MAFLEGLLAFNVFLVFFYLIGGAIHMGILFYIVHKGRREVTEGIFKNFINSVLVAFSVSLLFFVWSLLSKIGVLKIEDPLKDLILTTLISVGFLLALTYLSFTIRDLTIKFGFGSLGKKITFNARKAKREISKKRAVKARKRRQ
jgi:hypothetical protein